MLNELAVAVRSSVRRTRPVSKATVSNAIGATFTQTCGLASNPDPRAHVDDMIAHSAGASVLSVRRLEEAPPDVQQFSNVSNAEMVRSICHSHVPGWSNYPEDKILIDQLCEGLSNQNFKVHLDLPAEDLLRDPPCVLFRIYGSGASKLYDPELEVKIVMMLSQYGIGPRIYARNTAWRIESWHYSVPLPNRSMRNPAIWVQMAAHLGRLHKLQARLDFPKEISQRPYLSMTRLSEWGRHCKQTAEAFKEAYNLQRLPSSTIQDMLDEREWLKEFLIEDDPRIEGSGLDLVFCHWDAQENNVLQTLHGLRFIDFEYAGMDYQAFDIANYFAECAIDYLHPRFPYYKVTLSDLPTQEEMRFFCSIYLSEYLEYKVLPGDLASEVLSERSQRFVLASHLLWAMWSVIRAGQAPTYGGFDYVDFANSRWFMYKVYKRGLLHRLKGR